MVTVGDPITYCDDFEYLSDDLIAGGGRALDNRIGGFIIARAFAQLAARRQELNGECFWH